MEKKKRSFNELVSNKKSPSKLIPAPDIAYFARRGGLPPTSDIYAHRLSSESFDHVAESSNGTSRARYFELVGLTKVFSDVEAFRRDGAAQGVKVDDTLVRKHFPKLDFIDGTIPTGSPEKSAREAFESTQERWPDLKPYPPSLTSVDRPTEQQQGLKVTPHPNGSTTVEPGFSEAQVAVSYELLLPEVAQARQYIVDCLIREKEAPTVDLLRRHLESIELSYLCHFADDTDLDHLVIACQAKKPPRQKTLTRELIKRKTGLQSSAIVTYVCRYKSARRNQH